MKRKTLGATAAIMSSLALVLGVSVPAKADPVVFIVEPAGEGAVFVYHDHVGRNGDLSDGIVFDWSGTTCSEGDRVPLRLSDRNGNWVRITFTAPVNGTCTITASVTKRGESYGYLAPVTLTGQTVDVPVITVPPASAPIAINILPLASNRVQASPGSGSQQLTQSNTCPFNSQIIWTLVLSPSWVSINSVTGLASWTAAVPGTHTVVARATCWDGTTTLTPLASDDYQFEIVVPQPLFIDILGIPGNSVASQVAGSQAMRQANNCPVGARVSWSMVSSPSWASIDSETGIVSWTTPAAGSHLMQVRAVCSDTSGAELVLDTYEFTLVVEAQAKALNGILRASVIFGGDSSVLTPAAIRTIRNLVSQMPSDATGIRVTIVGYVYPTPDKSKDARLSAARAASVQRQLAALGVSATYTVRGVETPLSANPRSRRADIFVAYSYFGN